MQPSPTAPGPGPTSPDATSPGAARWRAHAGPVLLRTAGMTIACSVLFGTFVHYQEAIDHALPVGPWLATVALVGVFCASWVASDTAQQPLRTVCFRWAPTLLLTALAMALLAMVTGTERSRGPADDGVDVLSAVATSSAMALCLVPAVLLGILFGRATHRD